MIKKLKKTVALVVAFAMMFSLGGCSQGTMSGKKTGTDGKTTETDTEIATEDADIEDEGEVDPEEQKKFHEYLSDYFEEEVTSDSLSYHYTVKDGSKFGIEPPVATMGDSDMSEEAIEADKEEFDKYYNDLIAIDYNKLDKDEKFTYDVLQEYMENEAESYNYLYLSDPFSPMRGLQSNIATYFTDYSFYSKEDVETYITLINQLPAYFNDMLEFEKVKSEKGYFMSDTSCDSVIEQCNQFMENKDNHFMIASFNSRIENMDGLTDEEIKDYEQRNKDAVLNSMMPAFQSVVDTFTELKGTGTNDGGVCNYEGGKEYYAYLLKHYAGTEKTPDEVIKMLENEFTNIMTDLYAVYSANPDAYSYFAENYETLFSATDDMTADEIINKLMDTAMDNYPDIGKINYTSHYLDKSLETIMENTLAYYMSPAIDDQDNNIIYVNGLHPDGLWTTLAHEGCPGHMYQNAYFMQTDPEPVRTLYNFLGYKEGWAMYACYDAVNAYDFGDTEYAEELAQLYQINDELSYLIMGRIDIGVNYEGWDLDKVSSYLTSSGFGSDGAQDIFDTVTGDPGVYQSYVTGYYEMKELRDYAEEELQDKFDVVEFNKTILDAGPCQYNLLKECVDEYITESK